MSCEGFKEENLMRQYGSNGGWQGSEPTIVGFQVQRFGVPRGRVTHILKIHFPAF
jgi:hypothetical protein